MARFHDISLPITRDLVIYPGDPELTIEPHSRVAEGDDANVTRLSFGSHTGTHVDAASHFIDGGQTVDQLPLDRLIGPAVVVQLPDDVKEIGAAELRDAGVRDERRVLLRTRNADLLGRGGFRKDFAHLTAEGARYLVDAGVELVGIDYLSVEAPDADEPVAHTTLLEREVVIVEGVDLRSVRPGRYDLICLPLRLAGLDGSPVRAVLRTLDEGGPNGDQGEGGGT
jgi:arylformamidase